MKEYRIDIREINYYHIFVEADDYESAGKKGLQAFYDESEDLVIDDEEICITDSEEI